MVAKFMCKKASNHAGCCQGFYVTWRVSSQRRKSESLPDETSKMGKSLTTSTSSSSSSSKLTVTFDEAQSGAHTIGSSGGRIKSNKCTYLRCFAEFERWTSKRRVKFVPNLTRWIVKMCVFVWLLKVMGVGLMQFRRQFVSLLNGKRKLELIVVAWRSLSLISSMRSVTELQHGIVPLVWTQIGFVFWKGLKAKLRLSKLVVTNWL